MVGRSVGRKGVGRRTDGSFYFSLEPPLDATNLKKNFNVLYFSQYYMFKTLLSSFSPSSNFDRVTESFENEAKSH